MEAISTHEAKARQAKAVRLTSVLRDAGATVELVADPQVRAAAEAAAGTRPASETTWAMVEVLLAQEVAEPADAFAGLV